MAFISLVTALLMLLIFKLTSNQEGLKKAKKRVWARVLELWLFRSDFGLTLRTQKDVFLDTLRYLRYSLVPLAFMIIPVVLITLQVDYRFSRMPVPLNEQAIVKARVRSGDDEKLLRVSLAVPPGLTLKAQPVRIPSENEIDWLVVPQRAGEYKLTAEVDGEQFKKNFAAGTGIIPILPALEEGGRFSFLSNPVERPLPAGRYIESLEIGYPDRPLGWFSHAIQFSRAQWIIVFFVLSLVFAFLLKGLFRVEV